jgi:hypothetical protein
MSSSFMLQIYATTTKTMMMRKQRIVIVILFFTLNGIISKRK